MRTVKVSNYIGIGDDKERLDSFCKDINRDVEELFTVFNGRVRFGIGGDGDRGENISGEFQQFTSHATPNTEFSVNHGLGAIPVGIIIMWQSAAGSLYQGPTTGTNWTSSTIYLACDASSVTFNVFLIK